MSSSVKEFIRKDAHDIIAIMQEILDKDCEVSWPHRFAELDALLHDQKELVVLLHGGRDRYEAAVEHALFNG